MINITNYFDHPTRMGYTVFKFYTKQRADYFEELLKEGDIWYELSEEHEPRTLFLFGIKKGEFKRAMQANYLVSGKFRKKIIPNTYLRWGVLGFALLIIALAILGAILN